MSQAFPVWSCLAHSIQTYLNIFLSVRRSFTRKVAKTEQPTKKSTYIYAQLTKNLSKQLQTQQNCE